MAKTYAESVKLPNLVVNVPHPSTKYLITKNGLNVEGRNKSEQFNKEDFKNASSAKSFDRKAFITSLIGGNFIFYFLKMSLFYRKFWII
jgi:hypothetical protein